MPQMFPMPVLFLAFMVMFLCFLSMIRVFWHLPSTDKKIPSTLSNKSCKTLVQIW